MHARKLFGEENPLGRKMARFPGAARNPSAWFTIVGVAADARNGGLTDGNDPECHIVRKRGATDFTDIPTASAVMVRGSAGKVTGSAAMLRREIAALDPALPAVVRTFDQQVGQLAARPRFQAWLLGLLAGIGMLLAGSGLYGLVSFLVAQREREFGVRMALGFTRGGILKLVLGDALRWTLGGLVCGIAGAALAARTMRSLLFHVAPEDPAVYAIAAVLLTTLAMAAAFVPSQRATRVDPATALRQS